MSALFATMVALSLAVPSPADLAQDNLTSCVDRVLASPMRPTRDLVDEIKGAFNRCRPAIVGLYNQRRASDPNFSSQDMVELLTDLMMRKVQDVLSGARQ